MIGDLHTKTSMAVHDLQQFYDFQLAQYGDPVYTTTTTTTTTTATSPRMATFHRCAVLPSSWLASGFSPVNVTDHLECAQR